jgi:hypothetical protein
MRGGGNIWASIARLRRAGPKRIRRSLVTSSAPRSVLAACWIFCSEKELTNLTGHPPPEWPLVVVKELVDNAIDACEGAGIAPVVSVTVDAEALAFRYDTICADHAVPLLVVHDFKSIVGTQRRDTRRYAFQNKIEVVDVGMRLEDIEGLQAESSGIRTRTKHAMPLDATFETMGPHVPRSTSCWNSASSSMRSPVTS